VKIAIQTRELVSPKLSRIVRGEGRYCQMLYHVFNSLGHEAILFKELDVPSGFDLYLASADDDLASKTGFPKDSRVVKVKSNFVETEKISDLAKQYGKLVVFSKRLLLHENCFYLPRFFDLFAACLPFVQRPQVALFSYHVRHPAFAKIEQPCRSAGFEIYRIRPNAEPYEDPGYGRTFPRLTQPDFLRLLAFSKIYWVETIAEPFSILEACAEGCLPLVYSEDSLPVEMLEDGFTSIINKSAEEGKERVYRAGNFQGLRV